jgi:hypothetical protein
MKFSKIIQSIAGLFLLISLMACSKENTSTTSTSTTDVRDKAVGTYSGNANLKDSTGTKIFDTTTTFVVAKGSGNSITFTEEGKTIITDAIVVNGNNFSCNIPSQNFTVNGAVITLKGSGNNNEHFNFQDAQKVISYTYEITEGQMKGTVYNVFATKK